MPPRPVSRSIVRFAPRPVVVLALLLALVPAARAGAAVSGGLDPAFGSGGLRTQPIGTRADEAMALALDADGRLLVAGYAFDGRQKFGLARFTPEGTLDATLNGTGTLILALRATLDNVRAVLVQGDGKIVLAGHSRAGGSDDFALLRLLPDGSPDPGFGSSGVVITNVGATDDRILAATLQDDGRIVVAGYTRTSANRDVAVARYLESGALDPSFGYGGTVSYGFGSGHDEAAAVALQDDGKIVIAGYAADGSQHEMLVARLDASGALDPSFNGNGARRIGFGPGDEFGRGVAVQPDGRILVAGYAKVGTVNHFAVARVTAGGTLDPTFSGDGLLTTVIGTASEGRAIALHPRGRVVVAGRARVGANFDFALAQYRADGSPDPTFGTSGTVTVALGAAADEANAVLIQDDGNVVLAGTARSGTNNASADFAIARVLVSRCGDGFTDPEEECDSAESCCGGSCQVLTAGTVCRSVQGACDLAEACDGVNDRCPADDWMPAGVVCRAAAGLCDEQESCTGIGPACPADARVPAQTVCRAATDACDAAERCNGSAPTCPADQLVPAGTVCRPGTDACDAAESCDGASAACPDDALAPAGTVCRDAAGACDVAESCDGLDPSCPADVLESAGTLCRDVADACDSAEACDGASAGCPADLRLPDGDDDGVCNELDVCPALPDPGQSDADGDGIGDACDPCTSGAPPKTAVLRFAGFTTPAGDDSFRLKGTVQFAAPLGLAPEVTGVRVVIEGAPGVLHDVTVPPGAFDPDTRTGWTVNPNRTLLIFRSPTALGGLVNKVRIVARTLRPGFVQFKVTGRDTDFAGIPDAVPLKATVVLDPTRALGGVCTERSFSGPDPLPTCNLGPDGGNLVCR